MGTVTKEDGARGWLEHPHLPLAEGWESTLHGPKGFPCLKTSPEACALMSPWLHAHSKQKPSFYRFLLPFAVFESSHNLGL